MSVPARKTAETTLRTSARLWSAMLIGVIAILFAFPAGMTLAIINWQRMGMLLKARRYLYATVFATYAFVIALLLLPGDFSRIVYFVLNVIVFFFLRREIDQDTDAYAYAGNEVHPANPFLAIAIGFGILILIIFLFGVTSILLVSLGLVKI